jgi:hypothetical protein
MISRSSASVAERVLAGVAFALATCGHSSGKVNQPVDSVFADNEVNLWTMARSSSVVVARTVDAGASPGVWSSSFESSQSITVDVDEVLCGPPRSGRVVVVVPLVEGGRLVQRTPAVAPWLATKGARAIWFLDADRPADDDLGAFAADDAMVARVRALCGGSMPPGTPAVLHELIAIVGDAHLLASFAAPVAGVIDVTDEHDVTVARLTLAGGVLRTFSGVRLARIASTRAPAVTLRATPEQLARALTGASPLAALIVRGRAPELVDALARTAASIGADPALRARLARAAGTD